MTIQECYAQMGADYNEVFRRLYNEAMIRKFVLRFPRMTASIIWKLP